MLRQRRRGRQFRHRVRLAAALLTAAGAVCLSVGHGMALSNIGPDPTDFGGTPGVDRFGYIVTSPDYPASKVPESVVPLYYPNNTGTKTITIEDPDLCTWTRETAPASGGNYMDHENIAGSNPSSTGTAAAFFVHSIRTGADYTYTYSNINGSSTCYARTMTYTFPGNLLQFDNVTGLYTIEFHTEVGPTVVQAENRFRIILKPTDNGIVGLSANNTSDHFGTAKISPYNSSQWNNYHLPFAPSCEVMAPTTVQAVVYDMDNGDKNIQGGKNMLISIDDIAPSGTSSKIPLTFWKGPSSSGGQWPTTGNQNGYLINPPNATFAYITFTVQPGHKYYFDLTQVYFVNILQFQLPYDSIYFDHNCTIPPPPPPPPTFQPTFSVTGGDVVAGSTFAAPSLTSPSMTVPCGAPGNDPDPKAGITSWNTKVSPYAGAGNTLAAMALGYIQEFATSQGHSPPKTLSFSNVNDPGASPASVNLANGMFGGMFGAIAACVDYWGSKPPIPTMQPFIGSNLNGLAQGSYWAHPTGSPLAINNSLIPDGTHATLYVDGDVNIMGDIVYQHSNGAGFWTDVTDIPSLRLVVHGTIFINKAVHQLDGIYVAVPDENYGSRNNTNFSAPRPGTITTCAQSDGTSFDPMGVATSNYFSACESNLTVNGGFIANQIWLLRTLGTLGGPPAEVFNYGPEVWLPPKSGSYTPTYQSASGLPPVL